MCTVGLLMAGSIATSVVGGIQASNAEAAASMYSAQVNEQNAKFAERRARDALMRGAEEEQRVRQEGAQLKGQQIAGMAAAGLDLGFGSPLDVLVDTATGIELDAARVRRNADLEYDDYMRQGWSYRANAGMDRASAANAKTAGRIGAIGTVLGGAGDYYKYRASIA
ncbi:hypothetical protein [Microcystis phage Mel-JY33]